MRVQWSIAARFILTVVKVRANFFFMLLMPIVFTFLFGVLPNLNTDARAPVAVVDFDQSSVSQALVQSLTQDPHFKVKAISQGDVNSTLRDMQASLVLTVPRGFGVDAVAGNQAHVEITPAANSGGNAGGAIAAERALSQTISAWVTAGQVAVKTTTVSDASTVRQVFLAGTHSAVRMNALVTASGHVVRNGTVQPEFNNGQLAVIGFSAMFIMITVFGSTGRILEEKEAGTWARMNASPAKKRDLVLGYGLAFFLIGWLQYAVLCLSGRLLFGIDIPMSGWMALTVSLFILAACGIALCVAGLVKSREQHMALGSFVSVGTCMIGGAYWPTEIEPAWMQHVAWFTPQNWVMQAFKVLTIGTPDTSVLLWPLLILAGFAAVFFTAGMVQMRYS